MRQLGFGSVGLIAALAMSVAAVAQSSDRVTTVNKRNYSGTINTVTRNDVTVETRGGNRKIPVNEIESVAFRDDPRELRSSRVAALRGAYEQARDELAKISPDSIERDLVRQDLEFYLAWSEGMLALSGGDKGKAVRLLRAFEEAHPQSFHYYAVVKLLGELAVAVGRADVAATYFKKYAEAPFPKYQMEAAMAIAAAIRSEGKYAEALAEYEKVLANPLDSAEATRQKQFAQVGKAACLAELGKPDEGIKLVQQVIRSNQAQSNASLFARAYNALGDCYRKKDQPKEALMAYLHTDLLFYQHPDAHAEALYHLSRLWRESAKNTERALQAETMLRSRYAGTVWAKKATGS